MARAWASPKPSIAGTGAIAVAGHLSRADHVEASRGHGAAASAGASSLT
jgi:hypothetical protein